MIVKIEMDTDLWMWVPTAIEKQLQIWEQQLIQYMDDKDKSIRYNFLKCKYDKLVAAGRQITFQWNNQWLYEQKRRKEEATNTWIHATNLYPE